SRPSPLCSAVRKLLRYGTHQSRACRGGPRELANQRRQALRLWQAGPDGTRSLSAGPCWKHRQGESEPDSYSEALTVRWRTAGFGRVEAGLPHSITQVFEIGRL